jgi:hypothetical protein
LAPAGDSDNGITWQSLGSYQIANNQLIVRLGGNANGYVIADAVRIVANGIPQQVPEIDVAGSSVSIGVGDSSPQAADGTEFGSVLATTDSAVQTFTIANTGNAPLHLTAQPAVQLGGNNPQDFVIVSQPAVAIAPGSSSKFQVLFHPTTTGLRQAVISIASDDSDESLYQFVIEGTGTNGPIGVPLAHNDVLPVDVNNDQMVSARDAIIVINALNRPAPTAGALVATADAVATPAAATDSPSYYIDVDGDGLVGPHDAIMVINYLIRHPLAAAPATAPAAAPAAQPQVQAFAITDEAVSQLSDSSGASSSPPATGSSTSATSVVASASPAALTPQAVNDAFESDASHDDQDTLADLL